MTWVLNQHLFHGLARVGDHDAIVFGAWLPGFHGLSLAVTAGLTGWCGLGKMMGHYEKIPRKFPFIGAS